MKRFIIILLMCLTVCGTTTALASTVEEDGLPPYTTQSENSKIIIYKTATDTAIIDVYDYFSDVEAIVDTDDSGKYTALYFNVGSTYKYKIAVLNGNQWEVGNVNSHSSGKTLILTGQFQVLYSDINGYTNSGELVFPQPPIPLAEEIRGIAEKVLTVETMPKLNKTVLQVVLCGVGCLALLISLPLLRKTLGIFLH